MAWQPYVDTNLVGTGQVTKAAIFGHDGSQWASSAGFQISGPEVQALIGGFTNPAALRASGIHLAGEKYLTLRMDDASIYGKRGTGGCIAVKTGMAVLVGVYEEPIQPGNCANTVETLGDYLKDQGY
eukprot:TRINITY_DN91225_c0_g1_i1.p1 TRINITY_DN91225_c0_g1~~TRINITY_DN91225_c0_g1_i1.p1  ORF type:complete len:127 (+),score=58.00 TRINITY_DN91225_c0_g1_i1:32-412(+)